MKASICIALILLLSACPRQDTNPVGEGARSLESLEIPPGSLTEIEALMFARGVDEYGYTALMYEAMENNTYNVQALLDAGANVNARTKSGWTALMYAARGGYTKTVRALLATGGVDVNARDDNGYTALYYANRERHTQIIALLKKAGATE